MIGRIEEIKTLRSAYNSQHSEFVAVYGRRRIGKTFLVNEVFNYTFAFHAAGAEGASRPMQLAAFRETLKRHGHLKCPRLSSWVEAFSQLESFLEGLPQGKKIVFLDELPWFDTPCSGFLKAFELFWNGWATSRKDILLVVCGSATTWIVNKILSSRGGLHNRVTRQIRLRPFSLRECEAYSNYLNLNFDRSQILECYMVFGGVAYYWSLLQEGQSAAQNIDRLFFDEDGQMRNEFRRLFSSLFKMDARYVEIVRILGRRKSGMTRAEVLAAIGGTSGGDVSQCLQELVECGFLRESRPIGRKKKGTIYQLVDPFVLFYFRFVEPWKGNDRRHWTLNYHSAETNAWRGYAFELVCLLHDDQLRRALGIEGIEADFHSWRWNPDDPAEKGVQIDLLIDRADRIVNLCEIKYSETPYTLDREEYEKICRRVDVFRRESGIGKAVQTVLIAAHGVAPGKYRGNIQREVSGDDLFQ